MRPYHYRCHDYSLLTPTFKKRLVEPLLRFIPWIIPANIITIFSNGFVYLGLFLALNPTLFGIYTRLLVGACLLVYLIGDHMDGMQAKRTGTGSALGEFCDHYLDAFNNGIILFTVFAVFNIDNPILIASVMVSSYLAHMVVFYEQFKTGWLTFEKLGSLEAVLLSALIVAFSTLDSFYRLLTYTILGELSVIEGVMILSAVASIVTFITTVKRIPEITGGLWLFTVLLISVAGIGVYIYTPFQLFVIITLYASLYIGRIMKGHLVDGIERNADWVLPSSILVLAMIPDFPYAFLISFIYLFICISLLIAQTFSSLKVYWVWMNART